jgi:NTE family protein
MRIGVALSGGGVRCVAQIGILQVLQEMGVKISMISGTSGGAILGTLYAYGYSPAEIYKFVQKISPFTILKPAFMSTGLLDASKIEKELKKYFDKTTFEELKIPMVVACTDFLRAKPKYFVDGDFIRPIAASASIPIVFSPVKIGDSVYVDGGIVNNLPAEPLREYCDKIIGVHCNPVNDKSDNIGGMKRMFERTLLMAISCNAYQSKKLCDVFLEPEDLKYYRVMEYKKIPEIYEIGYKFGQKNKHLIEEMLQSNS